MTGNTPSGPLDLGRINDFIEGIKDEQRETNRRTLTTAAAIGVGILAYDAYKKFGRRK
jgi:hypothetical protein